MLKHILPPWYNCVELVLCFPKAATPRVGLWSQKEVMWTIVPTSRSTGAIRPAIYVDGNTHNGPGAQEVPVIVRTKVIRDATVLVIPIFVARLEREIPMEIPTVLISH
jgi:hypothetical protein